MKERADLAALYASIVSGLRAALQKYNADPRTPPEERVQDVEGLIRALPAEFLETRAKNLALVRLAPQSIGRVIGLDPRFYAIIEPVLKEALADLAQDPMFQSFRLPPDPARIEPDKLRLPLEEASAQRLAEETLKRLEPEKREQALTYVEEALTAAWRQFFRQVGHGAAPERSWPREHLEQKTKELAVAKFWPQGATWLLFRWPIV